MTLKFTPKQVQTIEAVLNEEHETVTEAAHAVLAAAVELIEDRAKFMVIGQLRSPAPGTEWDADEPYANRMCLGWFSTPADAKAAAQGLAFSTVTNESFRSAVMPVFHGTAAAYYSSRKAERNAKEMAGKTYFLREQQRRLDWTATHPGEPLPEDMRGVIPLSDPDVPPPFRPTPEEATVHKHLTAA